VALSSSLSHAITRGDASGNITEIKSGMNLSFTQQLQAQAAQWSFNLIVGPNTQYISGPLQRAIQSSGGGIRVFNPTTATFTSWP
jgi:filamentous hemagglutinin